jgi:2,3-bisphosphoglycerate-independent phosphoglycerate mutase
MKIEMEERDVAFRGNFASIDENMTIIDRRAGRINQQTDELIKSITDIKLKKNVMVLVKELTAHRLALVLKGENLSSKIADTDLGTANEGGKIVKPFPVITKEEDSEEYQKALFTSQLIWEFTLKSHSILSKHGVNALRKSKGLPPANIIILRGAGKKFYIDKITDQFGLKGAVIAGDKTITGIGKMVGLDPYTKPDFTGGYDSNYDGKARLAIELLHKNYDWVVIHVKAPDLAGHDDLPGKKVQIIRKIDKMAGIIYDNIDLDNCYFTFTADHATPCKTRDHTGDPVPSFIAGSDVRRDGILKIAETYFKSGSLNNLTANDLFMIQMDYMGFTKKFGA